MELKYVKVKSIKIPAKLKEALGFYKLRGFMIHYNINKA
jgi:hypothetical protein